MFGWLSPTKGKSFRLSHFFLYQCESFFILMLKNAINQLFRLGILVLLFSSCSVERKLAKEFLEQEKAVSILVIPPDYLFKTNLKLPAADSIAGLGEWQRDSIMSRDDLFLQNIDDSIFLDAYFSGLQNTLSSFGFSVYPVDKLTDFMNVSTPAYQVAVVQLEIEEDIYPYRAEEVFGDSMTYYKDFVLNLINVNNWYEITRLNDPGAVNNLLYASHYLTDRLEGRFVKNVFTGEVKFKYDLEPVDVEQIYQFARLLGEKYAGYIFDYLLNEHIYKNIDNNIRPKAYYHYDHQTGALYPAGDDRFIFMEQ